MVRFFANKRRYLRLARILNNLWPFSDKDVFDRYASFVEQGFVKSQGHILDSLMRFYPENTRFVVLPMDMKYMGAGDPEEKYLDQMKGLLELKKDTKYSGRLLPFVFAHPDRPGVTAHVREYIVEHGFSGIKIYPPLGYYPFDSRLDEIYAFAQEKQVPIMTHCSHPVVFYRGKIKNEWLKHPLTGAVLKKEKNRKFADNWTHPDNYKEVFRKFPNLKLCFGHFGGSSEWNKYYRFTEERDYQDSWFYKIKQLVKEHPNAYADVSYSLAEKELHTMLNLIMLDKELARKILFGSDFYMAKIEGMEFKFSIDLRMAIGENNFFKIAEENPKRFLGIKSRE
ncbi:MAG: amidohydrolase family protein [Bacteroidota bacterium]